MNVKKLLDYRVLAFLAIVMVHGLFALRSGPVLSSDSHTYSNWADLLIKHHFNYIGTRADDSFRVMPVVYLGFCSLVAVMKLVFGAHWAWGMVGINLVAEALAGVMLASLVYRLTQSRIALWFAIAAYLTCFEVFNWTRYVLSDSTYLFLTFSVVYLLARLFDESVSLGKMWLFAGALAVGAIIFRPPGITLAPVVIAAYWLSRRSLKQPVRLPKWSVWAAGALLVAVLVAHSAFMQKPSLYPRGMPGASYVDYLAGDYAKGAVVLGRPSTDHATPHSLPDYAWITLDKFVSFFAFYAKEYSLPHAVVSAGYFVPLYLLAIIGAWGALSAKAGSSRRLKSVVALSMLYIFVVAWFHALTLLEYDWRYRLPLIPSIILLASIGVWNLERAYSSRRAKTSQS